MASGGPCLGALCERRPKGIAVKRSGLWRLSVWAAWEVVCACGKATGEGQASPEPAAARAGVDFNAALLL